MITELNNLLKLAEKMEVRAGEFDRTYQYKIAEEIREFSLAVKEKVDRLKMLREKVED